MNDDSKEIHLEHNGVSIGVYDANGRHLGEIVPDSPGALNHITRSLEDSIAREAQQRAGTGILHRDDE